MLLDSSYPPATRLHRPAEFKAALRGRRVARGSLLEVLTPRLPAAPHAGSARLGMIIPKRQAALAVTRNTIKRVVREAFRLRRRELPAHDLVIRLHSRVPRLSLTQLRRLIREEIDGLLADTARRLPRSHPPTGDR